MDRMEPLILGLPKSSTLGIESVQHIVWRETIFGPIGKIKEGKNNGIPIGANTYNVTAKF